MKENVNALEIFKECFSKISVKELNRRINFFRMSVDLRTVSEERLKNAILELFKVDLQGSSVSFFLNTDTQTYPHQRFTFYRIRKFKETDSLIDKSFESIKSVSDVWAPPAIRVEKWGRLNRVNESVLYAAHEVTNAIYETDCKVDEFFFLLIYQNVKTMRLSQIHTIEYLDEFSEEDNAKRIILHNFLFSEFTRIVPPGKEHLYRSSVVIYEQFFKSDKIDGFCYPSIRTDSNRGFNICFSDAKAKENLKFIGLTVCRLCHPNSKAEFSVEAYYDGFLNEDGRFSFYPYNSNEARQRFGDFVMIRDMGL